MLTLTGIRKNYGTQPGVRDIDLIVPSRGRTVIVGPSGSGKTTLLRLIAGFETPDAGAITLAGRDLLSVPPHLRNIAYVAQEGALFPHMSVADNIGFAFARRTVERKTRIDDLLARVGLPAAVGARRPHELSGGQQQRVALARALAQQPLLMLLDEPFSALDTGLRETIRDMVDTVLREAGITSILVTHDQSEALGFADHLVVMRDARIADAGAPQRLYEQPRDLETARFLGDAIILPAEISDGIACTSLGKIPVRDGRKGSTHILIRPEQLSLAGPGAAQNTGTAKVLKRSFQGATVRLQIACSGIEQPITIRLPAQSDFGPEDEVHLSLAGMAHILEPFPS